MAAVASPIRPADPTGGLRRIPGFLAAARGRFCDEFPEVTRRETAGQALARIAERAKAGQSWSGPCESCGEIAELIELPTGPDWADNTFLCEPCATTPNPRPR